MDKPFSLSVKVVIKERSGKCLVLKRSPDSKANAGKWEFPGGKLDPGETFDHGLLREVNEETGLSVDLVRAVGAGQSEMPSRRVVYLFMEATTESTEVRLSSEHSDFRWVDCADLPDVDLAPQFLAFAKRYSQANDRYPEGTGPKLA